MIITIEPSAEPNSEKYFYRVSIDTLNNDETTTQAVQLAMQALTTYGHVEVNVASAAAAWADETAVNACFSEKYVADETDGTPAQS